MCVAYTQDKFTVLLKYININECACEKEKYSGWMATWIQMTTFDLIDSTHWFNFIWIYPAVTVNHKTDSFRQFCWYLTKLKQLNLIFSHNPKFTAMLDGRPTFVNFLRICNFRKVIFFYFFFKFYLVMFEQSAQRDNHKQLYTTFYTDFSLTTDWNRNISVMFDCCTISTFIFI